MHDIIRGRGGWSHEEDEDNDQLASFLSLGSKSYPLQIPPAMSSCPSPPPSLADGPMTLSPSHPDFTTWPPHESSSSWLSNSFNHNEGSFLPIIQLPYESSSSWLINSFHQIGGSFLTTIQPPYELSSSWLSNSFNQLPLLINDQPASPSNQTNRAMASVSSSRSHQTSQFPFPWATNEKGRIHTLEYLVSNQITTITGEVECSYCGKAYEVSYNLRERFAELEKILWKKKGEMRERAPEMWRKPEKERCDICGHEKSVKPKIAKRKSEINWLFMLLGQTLGHCTLKQLKNFCKHSKIHHTGALDRVLYLTYLGLCRMLQPTNLLFH